MTSSLKTTKSYWPHSRLPADVLRANWQEATQVF